MHYKVKMVQLVCKRVVNGGGQLVTLPKIVLQFHFSDSACFGFDCRQKMHDCLTFKELTKRESKISAAENK